MQKQGQKTDRNLKPVAVEVLQHVLYPVEAGLVSGGQRHAFVLHLRRAPDDQRRQRRRHERQLLDGHALQLFVQTHSFRQEAFLAADYVDYKLLNQRKSQKNTRYSFLTDEQIIT